MSASLGMGLASSYVAYGDAVVATPRVYGFNTAAPMERSLDL
jgi:hypothetical protein